MYVLANKSVYGAHVQAASGSEHIAGNNGIDVQKIKIRFLFLSSIFVAAILMSIISNGITALSWSSVIYNVVVGAVLVLIMAYMSLTDIYSRRQAERAAARENMVKLGMSKGQTGK